MTVVSAWALLLVTAHMSDPVTFAFLRGCGPAGGRELAYDPQARQYSLRVEDVARFQVRAVAGDLEAQPVVLRITGMIDRPEGPLTLHVDNKQYVLHHDKFDKALFRVERRAGVTTIEFLPKAKALLKPGTTFEYVDHYRE